MILSFNVNGQQVSKKDVDVPTLVSDSVNYLELCFSFPKTENEWAELTKRVLFRNDENIVYCKELDNENKVIVPFEVLVGGYFVFELYGFDEDIRITTNQVKFYLEDSGFTNIIEEASGSSDSLIEDIYNRLNNTVEMEVTYLDDSTETYNVVVK